jgi:hypothetical protein
MVAKRTKEEIEAKIKELCADAGNFTDDSYGLDDHGNMSYDVFFSEYASTVVMQNFVNWLFDDEIFKH